MTAYYNEIDPFAAEWLRNLIKAGRIAPGDVDERSIEDVAPDEIKSYTQHHFFAGIGVWSYALRRAGWEDDRPVWTGSAPCQPFSQAGKGKGFADERHLWPSWFWHIRQLRPSVIFGEQVSSKAGRSWFNVVSSDLEAYGYAIGAADLCAAGAGAPHLRQRLYFVADANGIRFKKYRESRKQGPKTRHRKGKFEREGDANRMDNATSRRFKTDNERFGEPQFVSQREPSFWSDCEWIFCADGRYRATESSAFPLAYRSPRSMGQMFPEIRELAVVAGGDARNLREAKRNNNGRLKGYGNAIVAPLAVEFIKAYIEAAT